MRPDDRPLSRFPGTDASVFMGGVAFSVVVHAAALAAAFLIPVSNPPKSLPVVEVELVDASTFGETPVASQSNHAPFNGKQKDEPRARSGAGEADQSGELGTPFTTPPNAGPDNAVSLEPSQVFTAAGNTAATSQAEPVHEALSETEFANTDFGKTPAADAGGTQLKNQDERSESNPTSARGGETLLRSPDVVLRPKPTAPPPRDERRHPKGATAVPVANLGEDDLEDGRETNSLPPSGMQRSGHSVADQMTESDTRPRASAAVPDTAADGRWRAEASPGASGRTPPRIIGSGANNPTPRYPFAARRRGQQGRVLLLVQVGRSGDVRNVRVKASSGYRLLDTAAVEAVKKWHFTPATAAGFAVPGQLEIPITFKLTEG